MVGRNKQETLDRLIGEVSRGERTLAGIADRDLREAVRIALRLHDDGEDLSAPSDYVRMRMRARIMAGLRPRAPTLRDNAWTALWYLGRPAPYIARAIVIVVLIVSAGMGATLASADSLPDDAMYPVKIAGEGVRLALAGAPEDRAAVELSIAEHRLAEAEKLAVSGRRSDALVASAVYSAHIAAAAAELSAEADRASVGPQLESSFNAQRERAQKLAVELAGEGGSPGGAQVLAMIAAPTMAPGTTDVERVAETAAALASDLADAAESDAAAEAIAFEEEQQDAVVPDANVDAAPESRGPSASSVGVAVRTAAPRATTASTHATTRTAATATQRATPHATPNARASDNAKAARKAADQARAAAEKLRQALQKAKEKRDHR